MKKKPTRGQKPGISISPEYSGIVPQLSDAEYEALKHSIKVDGQQIPIIVNEDGIILDGHHRYKACRELRLEPKTAIMKFETKDEERLFVVNTNLNRRQLNSYQRAVLALKKKPVLAKLAKQNMRQAKVSRIRETMHVDERLARDAGISKDALYRVEKIEREGSEELKDLARTGRFSINKAYGLIGKDVGTVLAYDHIQRGFEKISESISKMPPGSEQEQAALRYMENFSNVVDSISDEDWKNGNGLKELTVAFYGGIDGTIATTFLAMPGQNMPRELLSPSLNLDAGDREVFRSAADKMLKFPPYLVTFSTQERNLLLKMMKKTVSNIERYLGSAA